MTEPSKWTIVQHSAAGYKGDPTFAKGLETRIVNPTEAKLVIHHGGLVFDRYDEAENFAYDAMYGEEPKDEPWLIPDAKGTFSEDLSIDGLRIYIPVRKVVG